MRIAYVTDEAYPGFGGQATATEAHVRALVELGHEIRVAVGRQRGQTRPPEGVTLYPLPVFPLGSLSHVALPRRALLAPLVEWAEVIHINMPGPVAFATLRLARRRDRPVVMGLHIQEQNTSMHLGALRPLAEALLRRFYRSVFGSADCVVAPTAFAGRLARAYAPPRIEVISNGLEPFAEDATFAVEAEALREELRSRGDEVVLSYVGRLYPEKHPEALIGILAEARSRGLAAVLAIAGRGPLAERLPEIAGRAGVADHVRLLGFVDERRKHALLRASDVFLMPSEVELQSIAALEAMSMGCPVLAADYATSAVPELVTSHRAGVAYRAGDSGAAATALLGMLSDVQRMTELRRAARATAAGVALPVVGRRLEALYRELLVRRTRPAAVGAADGAPAAPGPGAP